tara:strand:+ start:164 stop:310 length:147 start_codon:yes stop_codon:yes gene_type:complete
MRFKVTMINDEGKFYEETVIANNKNEAKINVQDLNPKLKIVDAKWVYK